MGRNAAGQRRGSGPGDGGVSPSPLICPRRCCPIKMPCLYFPFFSFFCSCADCCCFVPVFPRALGWAGLSCFPPPPPESKDVGEGSGGRIPPPLLSRHKPGPEREKRSGFFLRSSPLIAVICNQTGRPSAALPTGFVEGGICLWGTLDPVCAGYRLRRSGCPSVAASHAVRTPHPSWMGDAEAVGPPSQSHRSPKTGRDVRKCLPLAAGGLR